jgi:Domain of unknown function (DUF5069)
MSAQYPRSPKVRLGDIAHLGRIIDKIRLRHAGQIQNYTYLTVGFDHYLLDFLELRTANLRRLAIPIFLWPSS